MQIEWRNKWNVTLIHYNNIGFGLSSCTKQEIYKEDVYSKRCFVCDGFVVVFVVAAFVITVVIMHVSHVSYGYFVYTGKSNINPSIIELQY